MANGNHTMTALVHCADLDIAQSVANDMSRTMGRVWIMDHAVASRAHAGMFLLAFKFCSPDHEAHIEAPIVREAVNSAGYSMDSITVK